MASVRVEHKDEGVPTPQKVVLEMTWNEFLVVNSLIGRTPAKDVAFMVSTTLNEAKGSWPLVPRLRRSTSVLRASTEEVRAALISLYDVLRPVYQGDVN